MSKGKSYFNNHACHHECHKDKFLPFNTKPYKKIKSGGRIKILDIGCRDGSFIKSTIIT